MTAKLFIDGVGEHAKNTLTKQLISVSRIGAVTGRLSRQWQATSSYEDADALCLGKTHRCGDVATVIKPVLTDIDIKTHSENIVKFALPASAMTLLDALCRAEEILSSPGASAQAAVAGTTQPDIEHSRSRTSTHQSAATDAAEPFFARYLKTYAAEQQQHVLKWPQQTVWFDRPGNKIYADVEMKALIERLADTAAPAIDAYSPPPADMTAFSCQALLWSYGLHAPLPDSFSASRDMSAQRFRLKKWPLFGQWETSAELLLLTTLFTQKFTSLAEARARSGLEQTHILHFLAAAETAGLPIDAEPCTQTASTDGSRREVAWINRLRKKLKMQDYLSN